ncbi:hypothetical protein K523DRAFT_398036 [Schizophyllum commune Tattone D]|nr:hypothetical protein K523DRAFT_398036 [Schizophyllum commune Tattone D]
MTGENYKNLTAHSAHPPSGGPANSSPTEGGDEDDYFDVDPGFDQAVLGFDLDTPPGPGYCAVPWYPNSRHSGPGRDVRWESGFKSFLIIRSRKSRAGGVYTDKNDVEFALQGLHPAPEFQEMPTFLDCLELWKADCRAGAHEHPPPTPQSHAPTSVALTSTPPNSRCASPSIFRSPLRLTGIPPSTPTMARRDNGGTKVLSPSPITPSKARGPSSPLNPATAERRASKPSPAALLGTPASIAASPRTPHASGTGYRGPPPPIPLSAWLACSVGWASVCPVRVALPPDAAPCLDLHDDAPHVDLPSTSAMSRSTSGRSAPEAPSTFIPPVWYSEDSKGLGLILTSSWAYARELRAMHGNIDVVTDSSKLNSISSATLYRDTQFQPRPPFPSPFPPTVMGKRVKAIDDPSRRAPGPTGWVTGTKRAFFDRHQPEFRATTNRGAFYDKITTMFMMKYGPGFDLATDLAEDLPDPDADDMTEDYSDLTAEEEEEARAYRKRLRKKIGQHYRGTEIKIKNANGGNDIQELFTDHAQAQAPQMSIPTHIDQYYSKLYYPTRVKPVFEATFAAEMAKAMEKLKEWEELGVDPPPGWKLPQQLPVRNRVTAECWHRETQSFKDAVVRSHQDEVDRQKSAVASAMEAPAVLTTPEDFQRAISRAGLYLQPIMNAVNGNTKLCASIFLFGPMPDDGGKLGVLSAHAGWTKGLNPQTLALFDPDGLSEIEGVLIDFAKNCYSDGECAERRLPGTRSSREITGASATGPSMITSTAPPPREASPPRQLLTRLRRAGETSATTTGGTASLPPARSASLAAPEPMPVDMTSVETDIVTPNDVDASIPNEATTCVPTEVDTRLHDEKETGIRDEMDIRVLGEVNTSVRNEVDTGVSDDVDMHLHDETNTHVLGEVNTSVLGEVNTSVSDEVDTSVLDEVDTSVLDEVDTRVLEGNTGVSDGLDTGIPGNAKTLILNEMLGVMPSEVTLAQQMPDLTASATLPVSCRATSDAPASVTMDVPHPVSSRPTTAASAPTLPSTVSALATTSAATTSPGSTAMPGDTTSPDDNNEQVIVTTVSPSQDSTADATDVEKGREEDVWKCKMPVGCPPHIAGIFVACSRGQEWGLAFARAVSAFLALERSLGFPILNHGRLVLAGSLRPPIYREWIVQKREFSSIVDIGEPREFGAKWWTWWEAMQPPLRVSPAGDLLAVDVVAPGVTHLAEWGHLEKCCGRDGLVQFLLTLVWWGDVVNDPDRRVAHPAQRLEWVLAVEDFREVLEALMSAPDFKRIAAKRASGLDYSINMSSKHGRDDGDDKGPAKSSKRTRTALSERAVGDTSVAAKAGPRQKGTRARAKPTNENKVPRPKASNGPPATASRQSTRQRFVSVTVLRTRT